MTPDQIHLLRLSHARLEPHAMIAALAFFRRLFELAPQIRPRFKTDIESQSAKLMDMIGLAVSLADRPASLEGDLRDLGARHVNYGVRDEDYPMVGRVLLDMLGEVIGDDFTPATKAAWTEFYVFISTLMLQGAAAARVEKSGQSADSRSVPVPGK